MKPEQEALRFELSVTRLSDSIEHLRHTLKTINPNTAAEVANTVRYALDTLATRVDEYAQEVDRVRIYCKERNG